MRSEGRRVFAGNGGGKARAASSAAHEEMSPPDHAESWADRACLGSDLVLWYGPPDDGPGSYEEPDEQRLWRERRAVQICATCPVIGRCLAAELTLPLADQHGVRGGMTAPQRRGLLRQHRGQPASWRRAAELGTGPCGPEAA